MEQPDYLIDNQERTWSNAFTMGFNLLLFLAFGGMFIYHFIEHPVYYGSLIMGLFIWLLVYEILVNAYMRVYYLNGELVFLRPLRKFSIFFRKKNSQIRIHPDEWTEVYRHTFKGSTAYYFRNGRTAAYFVNADGLNNFYDYLDILFPKRIKKTDSFPMSMRRRLKQKEPGRVV